MGGRDGGVFVDMTRHAPGLSASSHNEEKVPSVHAQMVQRRERIEVETPEVG